jgi:hypothetical protein
VGDLKQYIYMIAMKYIVSIDIGIRNMGLSITEVSDEYEFIEILHVALVDITRCRLPKPCHLDHCPAIADWMRHFMEEWKEVLEGADTILLERQPPQGLGAIEQLLFFQYRDKSVLVHPRVVHSYLACGHLDYDGRKVVSEKVAWMYLTGETREIFSWYDRRHDMADSIGMMLWWTNQQRKLEQIKKRMDASGLDRFWYVPRLYE